EGTRRGGNTRQSTRRNDSVLALIRWAMDTRSNALRVLERRCTRLRAVPSFAIIHHNRDMSTLAEVRFHIYPTDCDMLGHLNHATMLNFLERARWALLEPQIDVRHWARQPVFSVVRH